MHGLTKLSEVHYTISWDHEIITHVEEKRENEEMREAGKREGTWGREVGKGKEDVKADLWWSRFKKE